MDDRELIKFFNLESVMAHVWLAGSLWQLWDSLFREAQAWRPRNQAWKPVGYRNQTGRWKNSCLGWLGDAINWIGGDWCWFKGKDLSLSHVECRTLCAIANRQLDVCAWRFGSGSHLYFNGNRIHRNWWDCSKTVRIKATLGAWPLKGGWEENPPVREEIL